MAKSLHQLSPRAQLVVFIVLALATVAAAWQVLIGPERAELAARRTKLTLLRAEVSVVQATAQKLPALEREIQGLERSLVETTAVLPDEKDPQDVLRNLHDLASDAQLSLATFTPKPIAQRAQYDEWPILIGLEGSYHDLGRFFDRIAGMARLMSVSDLQIKTDNRPASRNSITATCVATTFVFKKDAPPAPAAPAGSAGGRP